jgi:hypothetical protein
MLKSNEYFTLLEFAEEKEVRLTFTNAHVITPKELHLNINVEAPPSILYLRLQF